MKRLGASNRAMRRRAEKLAAVRAGREGRAAQSRGRKTLTALTAGALSLPGLAGSAHAGAAADRYTGDYSYSLYQEDNIRPKDAAAGSERDRYEIDMHQFHFNGPAPYFENVDFDLDYVFETMSGATPYYIEPTSGTDSRPLQIMSGATIEENRHDVSLALNRYLDDGKMTVTAGISKEDDYFAGNFGFDFEKEVNDKNTTLMTSFAVSIDTIEPTDSELDDRVNKEDKQTYTLFFGLSQVMNKLSTLQLSLTYQHGEGYLTDPYKRVFFRGISAVRNEERPNDRNQVSLMARYRRHVPQIDGTGHADYTFYVDDWGINSHTVSLAWYQNIFDWMQIVPSARYYSQSEADFYALFFQAVPDDGHFSSDYRLSPYGAISYGLKVDSLVIPIGPAEFKASLGYQRYEADGDYALDSVKYSNPGLVSFHLFSGSITGRF